MGALIDRQLGYVAQGVFLGVVEINQQRAGRDEPAVALLQAQGGKRGHVKMLQNRTLRRALGKRCFFQLGHADVDRQVGGELFGTIGNDFLRTNSRQFVAKRRFRGGQQVGDQLARAHIRVRQRRGLADEGHA